MEPTNQSPRSSVGTIIIVVIILIILGLIVWALIRPQADTTNINLAPLGTQSTNNTQSTTTESSSTTVSSTQSSSQTTKTITVKLTDSGFSPASITVNSGDTVQFVNDSSGKMWVASDPHPVHTGYPAFDEKSAANNGESFEFTFHKAGTWGYHNHLNPSEKGTVKVVVPNQNG